MYCVVNNLSALDVSKNTGLVDLNCEYNPLSNLDVSKNLKLKSLSCRTNELKNLDVSNNLLLNVLACSSNQLSSLNISKHKYISMLWIEDMPTLKKVCVWTMPFPPENLQLRKENSPNVYFSTDCTSE